jgi:hypothetical protein
MTRRPVTKTQLRRKQPVQPRHPRLVRPAPRKLPPQYRRS